MHPAFAAGTGGRVLCVMAPAVKRGLDARKKELFGDHIGEKEVAMLQKMLMFYRNLLERARLGIDAWSLVARRLGMAKDMRVAIAKLLWEENWKWGEKNNDN